jgi:hypothetical protein
MKKTSVKARMLVEKSPFVSADGVIFTGEKTSRLFGIDLSNGQMIGDGYEYNEYDSNNVNSNNINVDEEGMLDMPPLTSTSSSSSATSSSSSTSSSMWLGRIDYTVRAFDGETGREKVS